jgi:hypothetical protein
MRRLLLQVRKDIIVTENEKYGFIILIAKGEFKYLRLRVDTKKLVKQSNVPIPPIKK